MRTCLLFLVLMLPPLGLAEEALPTGGAQRAETDKSDEAMRLAADVVAALAGEVDFAAYDAVMLVHAGAGEETDILGKYILRYLSGRDAAGGITFDDLRRAGYGSSE